MNKVYKDGIGWVAIVKNSSCVSSSKGSGTVVEKSGVEVLKNFFDLRNSVVLNNGFLLKGLFAATLFCGVFVGNLKAEVTPDITRQQLVTQTNGNIVYTTNGGDRVARFVKSMDGYIDGQGRGYIDINGQWYKVDSYDERGVITLKNGKRYVLPTGTLARADGKLSEVRFFEFGEKFTGAGKATNKEVVRYDAKEKKWYVYNLADDEKLYAVKSGNSIKYFRIGDLKKNSDGTLYTGPDGYYVSTSLINANEQNLGKLLRDLNLMESEEPDINNLKRPDRLGLVDFDGKSTAPEKYTPADEANGTIPAGRKVGDNKNGKIRLGNVAKAKLDDEAVNLGQLNQTLQSTKVHYIDINSSITGPSSNYDNDGAIGKDAIAIGPNAKAGDNSVAVGFGAKTGEGVIDRDSYNIGSNSLVGFKKQLQKNINEAVKKRDEAVENYNKAITYPDKSKYDRIKNEQQELINKYEKIKATYEKIIDSYEAQYEYNGKLITQAEFDKLPRTEKMKIRKTVRYKSNAFYENSVAIGHDAHTLANDAVAIGSGAKVIANGGVAIGQGSVSNVRATDLVGYEPLASDINKSTDYFIKHQKSTWEATDQPFAVGDDTSKEKITRQITGVAAGTRDTDAVNVAQLKQIGLYAEGDIGDIGDKIHTEKKGYNTLKIKTDGNWEDNKTNVVYTGKNLETRFTKGYFDQNAKKDVNSKFEIAMTDKPRFKSITIADDNVTKNQEDKSPIELKKFGYKTIGFAGENNSTIKLTNLADGNITKDSTDAVTGKQLYDVNQTVNKGFLTQADYNATADTDITKGTKVSHALGGVIKVRGDFELTGSKKDLNDLLSGENLATSINKDGSINLLMARTPKFDDINISKDGNYTSLTKWIKKIESSSSTGGSTTAADLSKKADLNASNLQANDVTSWKKKLGIKSLTDTYLNFYTNTGNQTVELGSKVSIKGDDTNSDWTKFDSGKNIMTKIDNQGNIVVGLSKDLKNINSITTENNGTLTINAGTKKYTFGDTTLGNTSVVTNKDLTNKLNNYVTASAQKTTSVSADSNSGIKVNSSASGNNTDYKLSLDKDTIKNIAGTTTLAADLSKKADLNASNLQANDVTSWKKKLGIKSLTDTYLNFYTNTGNQTVELGSKVSIKGDDTNSDWTKFDSGKNIMTKIDNQGNIVVGLSKDLKNINSITTENNGTLTINAGTKKYTFGDTTLGNTSVVTNKDLTNKLNNYVTASAQKTTSVSADSNSGIKVNSSASGNNTDYKLSLDKDTIKNIAGTTTLAADLSKKADLNASNLQANDVTSWKKKLGIKSLTDTYLNFYTNTGNQTVELGSKVSIKGDDTNSDWTKFDSGKNIMTKIDNQGNIVVGLSKDLKNINSITTENNGTLTINAGTKKYTFGDTTLGNTSVVTNKDLTNKLNNYVTASAQKTTSVSADSNSGIKVNSSASGNNTDYKLSLDKDTIKNIAGTTTLAADLSKKADLNASNLQANDVTSWKKKLGIKSLTDTYLNFYTNTGNQTVELGSKVSIKGDDTNSDWTKFDSGKNIMTKIDNQGNIVVGLSKDLKNINSITTENNGTLTINAGTKKYTFGDTTLGNTSVVTNKDLTNKLNNYVTASAQKTTSVSADSNSGIKVNSSASGNNTDYKLSLDKDTIKNIAGTTTLAADLSKKADLNASNLQANDVTSWKKKLGIKSLTDTYLNFYTNTGNQTVELGSKVSIKGDDTNSDWTKFDSGKNIMTKIDNQGNIVVGLSKDLKNINSITTENNGTLTINAGTKKYTFGDTTLGNTSVVTNKDLTNKLNNYVTASAQKTTSVSADSNSGIKVNSSASGNNTDYKLSLDKDTIKNIAGTTTLAADLSKKADLNASNLQANDVTSWKKKLGIKSLTDTYLNFYTNTGNQTVELGSKVSIKGDDTNSDWTKFDSGKNIMTKIDNQGNIVVGLSKDLKNINSITTENNGTLTINAGTKKYTFGDTTLGNTSVVTNKDLTNKLNNYVTASAQKTTSVSADSNSGIKVNSSASGNNTDYKLSLDKDTIKNIAGTTTLAADLSKKADLNASNLQANDVTSWKKKLGIKSLTDTYLNFYTNTGNQTVELGSKVSIKGDDTNSDWTKFDSGKNIMTKIDNQGNIVVGLSKDLKNINSITTENNGTLTINAGTKKYTFGDTTLGNTSVVTNEILTTQLNNLSTQISNKDFNITLAADKGNATTTKTNKQIGIVGANGNIKTEANGTHLKIGLSNNVEFDKNGSKNGSIVFATGKNGDTNITKNNITSKDIVATNGTNTVKISGESGTITGLTNTEWNGTTDDISRAATEGQLQKFTQLLQKDINKSKVKVAAGNNIKVTSAVDATTGATTYTVATSDDVNFTKVTVGNTIIQNNNISVGKNISITDKEIKNGNVTIASNSIDINRTKLDKDGLTITSPDANKTVSLTKDGLNNGGNKITNVADGVAANDAATVGQLQKIKNVVNNSPVVASVNKDHWAEQNATATGKNSVSIGGGSSDDNRSNTVSVGAKGHERTISNVAPGIKNSDAATVGQLKSGLNEIYGQLNRYKKQSSAGTAAAMAIGNMPQSTVPGKGMISLGGGFYDGQSAMAIGLSKMSDDGRWVVKGSASYDSQDKAGASVSVGFHF